MQQTLLVFVTAIKNIRLQFIVSTQQKIRLDYTETSLLSTFETLVELYYVQQKGIFKKVSSVLSTAMSAQFFKPELSRLSDSGMRLPR